MRKGISIRAALCTNEQITKMVMRTAFLISCRDAEDTTPAVTSVLFSFTQWRTWWESWHTYTKQLCGANDIPLRYIHRLHPEVTDAIDMHDYADTDKEYVHMFRLEGVEFTADSKCYFET